MKEHYFAAILGKNAGFLRLFASNIIQLLQFPTNPGFIL